MLVSIDKIIVVWSKLFGYIFLIIPPHPPLHNLALNGRATSLPAPIAESPPSIHINLTNFAHLLVRIVCLAILPFSALQCTSFPRRIYKYAWIICCTMFDTYSCSNWPLFTSRMWTFLPLSTMFSTQTSLHFLIITCVITVPAERPLASIYIFLSYIWHQQVRLP